MRYDLIPETPEEERLVSAPDAARAGLDTLVPVVQAKAIMTANRLGVFETLAEGALPAQAIAAQLELDPSSLELLLRVLLSSGYLAVNKDGYRLTPRSRNTLLASSPNSLRAYVSMNEIAFDQISRMGSVVRSGKGIDAHESLGQHSDNWRIYQTAMLESARRAAPVVARHLPVRENATRLLDIGGSHGLYGAMICRNHPPLRSEVLDLPQAVAQSIILAQQEGVNDVVTHRAGNALSDELGSGYDVVFLGNILHHLPEDDAHALVLRSAAALGPGGTLAIWEEVPPEADRPPELVRDSFALLFRIASSGRCYRESEFEAWFREAGLIAMQAVTPPETPFRTLIHARRPE